MSRLPFRAHAPRRTRVRTTALALVTLVVAATGLVALGTNPAAAASASALTPGQGLDPGGRLTSPGGAYALIMQTDGNLVQYGAAGARWTTGTAGNPGAALRFQTDGNVVLYSPAGRPLWTTGTRGNPGATAFVLQDDGNMVAYGPGGALWNSGTVEITSAGPFTGGAFSAGMQSDGNFVLSYHGSPSADPLWSSGTWGHPRARLILQGDGNLVVYDGGAALWSTGTWGNPGAAVVMQADGNLVVYSRGGRALWNSGTNGVAGGVGTPGDGRFTLAWSHVFDDANRMIVGASPGVGVLDGGGTSVIVGDRGGAVYAMHVADGSFVPGWPIRTGVPVESTPSTAGSGASAGVFLGLGLSSSPSSGGILAVNGNGSQRFYRPLTFFPDGSGTTGVQGSVGLGSLQTGLDATAGTMGQMQYAVDGRTGANLSGFPWFGADTNFSTPSILTIGNATYIVQGGDSSAGVASGRTYRNGGHIRVLSGGGHGSNPDQGAGLACSYDTDQTVQSSPAIGNFLSGGRIGIVVGTGEYWPGARDTNAVIAVDTSCNRQWQTQLDGSTVSSPALIDVLGTSRNAVVEGTYVDGSRGSVYALDAATGAVIWRTSVPGGVRGSITSIDLGGGYQSLLVPTGSGVYVIDGRTGRLVSNLAPNVAVFNTAAVTLDPGNVIGVTVAGFNGTSRGVVLHYRLTGSSAPTVGGPGQWPTFKRDTLLSGVSNN